MIRSDISGVIYFYLLLLLLLLLLLYLIIIETLDGVLSTPEIELMDLAMIYSAGKNYRIQKEDNFSYYKWFKINYFY